MNMTVIVVLGAVVALGIMLIMFFIGSYNKLVSSKEMVENSRGQIATQIESRWDALTSLIQATQQYTSHEKDTLDSIVSQRSSVGKGSSTQDLENAEDEFQGSLSRLLAVTEAYPDLKASEVYQKSMDSVDKYEKNVRLSRMTFNDTITRYNKLIVMIPTNIIAGLTGHTKETYFESTKSKESMPGWE